MRDTNHEICSEAVGVGKHQDIDESCWNSEFLALTIQSALVEFFRLSSFRLTHTTKQTFLVNKPVSLALFNLESPKSLGETIE